MSESVSASQARKNRLSEKVSEEVTDIQNVSISEQEETVINDDGEKVITGAKKTKTPRSSNMHSKEDNVLGSRAADNALNRKTYTEKPEVDEKIALWSDKNIRWSEVGTLTKGYNIVTKEAAMKWIDRAGIRNATPEEVAKHFGK